MKKPRLSHPYQWIDWLYLQTSKEKLFQKGWGDLQIIDEIIAKSQRLTPPVDIEITIVRQSIVNNLRLYECEFISPSLQLPAESRTARFCVVLPHDASSMFSHPVCISMPGSGEEGYARRIKTLAKPLAKKGVASIILENPLYGSRKRQGQSQHYSESVSDFLLMFYSAIEECKSLIHHWTSNGQDKIAITGFSMGGQAVALASTQVPNRLAVIPSLAPSSVAELYAYGHLGEVCNWKALAIDSDEESARKKIKEILEIGDIKNFSPPRQSICSVINAKNDTYIPAYLSDTFTQHWPHSKVKLISGGHISSILFKNKQVIAEIIYSINLL